MKMLDALRQILMPPAATRHTIDSADFLEFQQSRDRFHKSAKRLSKAISDDKLGDMIGRLQHKPRKHTNGR